MMETTVFRARDVMKEPITVNENTRIIDAIERVINEGIGALVVVRNDKPVGIVTKRDLLWSIVYGRKDPYRDSIRDIMSKNLIVVDPDTEVSRIANLMINNNISHVPVVDGDQLVGIISDSDLVELLEHIIEVVETETAKSIE
jgi:CBS domain-containing protein